MAEAMEGAEESTVGLELKWPVLLNFASDKQSTLFCYLIESLLFAKFYLVLLSTKIENVSTM